MSLQGTLFREPHGKTHFIVDNAMGRATFDMDDYENEGQMFAATMQSGRMECA